MTKNSKKLLLLTLIFAGCTSQEKAQKQSLLSETKQTTKENPVDIFGFFGINTFETECPPNHTRTQFGITDAETLELNENPFTQIQKENPVIGSLKSIIEFCADFDNLKFDLLAVDQLVPSIGAGVSPRGHGYKVTKEVDASSFSAALEAGDWSLINITFENTEDPETSVWFKGWKDKSGNPYVTLNAFNKKLGEPSKISLKPHEMLGRQIQKGIIVEENPLIQKKVCSDAEIVFATGKISYNFCWQGNNATGFRYDLNSLSIIDNSKELSKPVNLILDANTLKSHFKPIFTHHGLTDSFQFETAESKYILHVLLGDGNLTATYKNGSSNITKNIVCELSHVRSCGINSSGPKPM